MKVIIQNMLNHQESPFFILEIWIIINQENHCLSNITDIETVCQCVLSGPDHYPYSSCLTSLFLGVGRTGEGDSLFLKLCETTGLLKRTSYPSLKVTHPTVPMILPVFLRER